MVIEKLKEREDRKEDREDQQMIAVINSEVDKLKQELDDTNKNANDIRLKMYELFNQYRMITWRNHPMDYE